MKNINWWRVASIALLAGSALLGFGHDLIEDQKSEDELHDMVQEEVRKQLAEKTTRTDAKNSVCFIQLRRLRYMQELVYVRVLYYI